LAEFPAERTRCAPAIVSRPNIDTIATTTNSSTKVKASNDRPPDRVGL